jgi:hypothetical protein
MGILGFLFGKKPKINFTNDGLVSHDLDAKKWDAWKDRYTKAAELDWKTHRGMRGKGNPKIPPSNQ